MAHRRAYRLCSCKPNSSPASPRPTCAGKLLSTIQQPQHFHVHAQFFCMLLRAATHRRRCAIKVRQRRCPPCFFLDLLEHIWLVKNFSPEEAFSIGILPKTPPLSALPQIIKKSSSTKVYTLGDFTHHIRYPAACTGKFFVSLSL